MSRKWKLPYTVHVMIPYQTQPQKRLPTPPSDSEEPVRHSPATTSNGQQSTGGNDTDRLASATRRRQTNDNIRSWISAIMMTAAIIATGNNSLTTRRVGTTAATTITFGGWKTGCTFLSNDCRYKADAGDTAPSCDWVGKFRPGSQSRQSYNSVLAARKQ